MKLKLLLPFFATAMLLTPLHAEPNEDPQIEKLIENAKQAKAEGRGEEAETLLREARKLHRETAGRENREGLDHPKRHIQELRKDEKAERLEQKLAANGGRPINPNGPARLRHLMEAIKHLRAAGLDEPAAHLEQMASKMRQEFEKGGPGRPGADQAAIREMQAGMQEMRGQLEKMAHAIEELREQSKK